MEIPKKRMCTKCEETKPLTEEFFRKNKRYAEGFETWCKECHKEATETWRKKEAGTNPDYYKNNALRKHRMTIKLYENLLQEQDGHCALCDATHTRDQRLSVDHDHNICHGKYACDKCRRGLLCGSCNANLGYLELFLKDAWVLPMLGKNGSWVGRALKYILDWEYKHRAQTQNAEVV